MKARTKKILIISTAVIAVLCIWDCKKNNDPDNNPNEFILSSPEIGADSLLPSDYTCDGVSATLPLAWSGAPAGTVSFALIMDHIASPTDIHWYWILYNIPYNVTSLPRNVSGIGTLGTNSVNDKTQYAPPCSQGPGIKSYTYTIYALSSLPVINIPASQVDRDELLNAIKNITLSSVKMRVYYSRKSL